MQNSVYTSPISLSATGTTIASVLATAASTIPTVTRECTLFSVTVKVFDSTRIQLTIQFVSDNSRPMALLNVDLENVQGKNNDKLK